MDENSQYLHRRIATRPFKQTFNLADHVKVTGASLDHGLLTIELEQEVSEAPKPHRIKIANSSGSQAMGQDNQPPKVEHDETEMKTKAA